MDLLPTAGPGPLLRPALLGAGVTDDELRRLRRRGELAPLAAGAYVDPADPRLRRPESRHALLVAAALPRVAPTRSSATCRPRCCTGCRSGACR